MDTYVPRLSQVELRMRERVYELDFTYGCFIGHPRIRRYIKHDLIKAFKDFYRLGQGDARWDYEGCQNCLGRGYQLAPELPGDPKSDKRLWFCMCERGRDLLYLFENGYMQRENSKAEGK